MTVLKASQFEGKRAKAERFNLSDIESEAGAIVAAARAEAAGLVEQAREQGEREREAARAEGFALGQQEGREQGRQEGLEQALEEARGQFRAKTEKLVAATQAICGEFDSAKANLLALAEQQTVALAVAIARKVVKQAGIGSRQVAAANVRAALEMLARKTDVVVRVNPAELEHLEQMGQAGAWGQYGHVRFEADGAVGPGGCVLTTDHGCIDGELDVQVDRIAAELLLGETADERRVLAEPAEAAEAKREAGQAEPGEAVEGVSEGDADA